jgi:hypothetical protein
LEGAACPFAAIGTIIRVKVTANKASGLCIFVSLSDLQEIISLSIIQNPPPTISIRETVLLLLGYIFFLLNGNSAG